MEKPAACIRWASLFYQQMQNSFATLKLEEMMWQLAKGQVVFSCYPTSNNEPFIVSVRMEMSSSVHRDHGLCFSVAAFQKSYWRNYWRHWAFGDYQGNVKLLLLSLKKVHMCAGQRWNEGLKSIAFQSRGPWAVLAPPCKELCVWAVRSYCAHSVWALNVLPRGNRWTSPSRHPLIQITSVNGWVSKSKMAPQVPLTRGILVLCASSSMLHVLWESCYQDPQQEFKIQEQSWYWHYYYGVVLSR